jgi:hypothetical protein
VAATAERSSRARAASPQASQQLGAEVPAGAHQVHAQDAQRARDGAAARAVTGGLAGGEERVRRQLQREEQRGDLREPALAVPGQRQGEQEDGDGGERHGDQRQRVAGEQHVGTGRERDTERGEDRRARHAYPGHAGPGC